MKRESGYDPVLPFPQGSTQMPGPRGSTLMAVWGSLVLTFALLFLSLTLMTLLARAQPDPPILSTPEYLDAGPEGQHTVRAWSPELYASQALTDPITSTALLPLAVCRYTDTPPPWTGEIVDAYSNCTLTRLFGFVLNQYDELEGDVWVHYWADGWDGAWARSSWETMGDHNWDGTLDNRPREVLWYACVVPEKKSWDCQSNTVEAPTSANCQKGIQVYRIDFRRN